MQNSRQHTVNTGDGSGGVGQRMSQKLVASLLLASLLLMGVCGFGLWMLNRNELSSENENLQRLALSLAEHTGLAFREIDIVLRDTQGRLSQGRLAQSDAELHHYLRERYKDLPHGQALLAFDASGRMRGHSRDFPTPKVNIADRDYFIAQQNADQGLYLPAPLRNRVNNRWMFSLSRRLNNADGTFGGVVMAAVEVEYFTRLYKALNLPQGARLDLYRSDGMEFASYPFDESLLGKAAPPSGDETGMVTARSEVPSLGLTVRISMPKSVVLTSWTRHMAIAGAGMLAAVLGVVALTATRQSYVRQLKHRTWLLQQSEAALRESEERYRTFVETSNDGICAIDADMRVTYANQVVAEMVGYDVSEVLGRHVADFVLPEDMDFYLKQQKDRRDNRRGHYECRLRRSDGREVWVLISSAPIMDAQGVYRGSFAMLADISQHKEQEKFREGIESILRHDLRSPLVSMAYIPSLLQDSGELNAQQQLAVRELRQLVSKMLRMVDAYLGLSKIEKKGYQLDQRPVNLCGLVGEVGTELEGQMRGNGKRLEVTLNSAPLQPDDSLVVQGESVLLYTMLTNLVKNALEAAPDNTPVRIDLRSETGSPQISIHNQGEVPASIRPRFFGKYVTSGKSQGTGLGAYSARLIAEAHGGNVELDASEPGATTVRVTLSSAAV